MLDVGGRQRLAGGGRAEVAEAGEATGPRMVAAGAGEVAGVRTATRAAEGDAAGAMTVIGVDLKWRQ
jgi:hypothetical protein